MRSLTRLCCILFVIVLPLLSSILAPTASASNFTLNSLADTPDANTSDGVCADANGACTLRAAIQQANADPSGDVIGFGTLTGTVTLLSPLPDISKSMTINGNGTNRTTVLRPFDDDAPFFRIFTIRAGATVSISGLNVRGGFLPLPASGAPPVGGGGIYNAGDLTLTSVNLSLNATADSPAAVTPVTPANGGGIYNDGVLTMTGCSLTFGTAGSALAGTGLNGGNGGGIYNAGTLSIADSIIDRNSAGNGGDGTAAGGPAGVGGNGGGIYNAASGARQVSATVTNCHFGANTTGNGGAVMPGPQAETSLSGNGGNGGGIYNASSMFISRGFFSGNTTGIGANAPAGKRTQAGKGGSGGGVYNNIPAGGGEMRLVNSIFVSNSTGKGGVGSGVIISEGDGGNGGGVANPSADSVLKMSHCTVVDNSTGLAGDGGGRDGTGGGVYGTPRIRSNIIARNQVRFPTNRSDVSGGPIMSSGYNFLGFFASICCFTGTDRGGSGSDPFLDPATLIPLQGSLVVDAGLALDLDDNPVTTDRRGAVRPFDFPDVAPPSGGDNSDIGALERQATDPTPTPTPTTVQFSTSSMHITEDCAQAEVTITRSEPRDGTTIVGYSVTSFFSNAANQRGDFTQLTGQVTFAPGEATKTIQLLISEDAYHEDPETFLVFLNLVSGGTVGSPNPLVVTIDDDDAVDGTANPIDDNATFVGQHYHDFLSRHADAGGQAFWTARLDECGGDAACLDRKRVDVSAAFFLSIEFLNTGYYVIRANKVGLGDQPGVPEYFDFLRGTQNVARGVVVGEPGFEAVIEANKQRYAEQVVQRSDFQTAHGSQTAAQYVDSLFANVGVTPTTQERNAAISAFGAGGTAGQVAALRSAVESGSVYNKLYNESFVLMQYFGYLRRNPNASPDNNLVGYNFWLGKLNEATLPGEDARDEAVAIRRIRRAEMVRSFLLSTEYRGRFAGDASRGNP